jgi:geranylgeranyl pyrophosphate synthase
LEFLHQFLLIHDDIMDKDTVRYGGPNIMGVYAKDYPENLDIAESTALLAGDVLFAYSNQAIVTSRTLSPAKKIRLLDQINQSDADVAFGQQLDTYNLDGLMQNFTEERLVQTHRLKTASYTMKLPMLCAAIVLGLPVRERRKIVSFAEPFGILFQLADDYSDYFDNGSAFNNRHNRPKHRDFPQGKLTYPVYIGLKLADKHQREVIRRNLGKKDITPKEMDEVVATLEACGAKTASRKHLEQFHKQAVDALESLTIDTAQKKVFRRVLDKYRV